jgi:hypothetical protein
VKKYEHTQIGYLLITAYSGVMLILGLLISVAEFKPFAGAGLILIILALSTFATLTVVVDNQVLMLRFGIGLIRKRFRIKEITACRVVKNPWYYGWGIRYTPRGWLYRVSGAWALELEKQNGRTYRIGTDAPHALAEALEAALEQI